MMAAKNIEVKARNSDTAMYIGVSLTLSIVRIENMPPMLKTTKSTISGAMCFESLSPNTAQIAISTNRNSS